MGVTDTTHITDTLAPPVTSPVTDTVTLPAPPQPDNSQPTPVTYVVRAGDTLSTLARRYSVTIAALAQANHMSIHSELRVGRQLTITPVQPGVPCWRNIVGQTGETVATIADRYSADADRLAQFNDLTDGSAPASGHTVCIPNIYAAGYAAPPADFLAYIVQPGDTLQAIANRYNVPVAQLQRRNDLINPNYLDVGQRLEIPR